MQYQPFSYLLLMKSHNIIGVKTKEFVFPIGIMELPIRIFCLRFPFPVLRNQTNPIVVNGVGTSYLWPSKWPVIIYRCS